MRRWLFPLLLGLVGPACDDNGGRGTDCASDQDCRRGTRCEPDGLCSEGCNPDLCVAPFECVTATLCEPVACQADRDCGVGEFCQAGGCYDLGGRCGRSADCPTFSALLEPTCRGGFCRLQGDEPSPTAASVPGFSADQTTLALRVRFDGCDGPAPCLRWIDPDGPRPLALVAMAPLTDPRTGEGLAATQWLLWPDPSTSEAAFGAGAWVTDGVERPWDPADPRASAPDTLYAMALAYAPGEIVAVSPAVPFNFAQAWSQAGSACDAARPCVSPGDPLVCHDGACQPPCASNQDCDASQRCGGLLGTDVRVCEDRL